MNHTTKDRNDDIERTIRIIHAMKRFSAYGLDNKSLVMRAIQQSPTNSSHFFENGSPFNVWQSFQILECFNRVLAERGEPLIRSEYISLSDGYMTEADITNRFSPLIQYVSSLGLVVSPNLYFVGSRRDIFTAAFDISESVHDLRVLDDFSIPSPADYQKTIDSCRFRGDSEPLYKKLWEFSPESEYDSVPFLADIRAALDAGGRSAVSHSKQYVIRLKSDPSGNLAAPTDTVITNAMISPPDLTDLYTLLPSAGLVAVLCDVSYNGTSKGIFPLPECVRFYSALNSKLEKFLADSMTEDTVYNFFQ